MQFWCNLEEHDKVKGIGKTWELPWLRGSTIYEKFDGISVYVILYQRNFI